MSSKRAVRRAAQRLIDAIFGKPPRMSPAEREAALLRGIAETSKMLREQADAALARLSPREREIIEKRYGERRA